VGKPRAAGHHDDMLFQTWLDAEIGVEKSKKLQGADDFWKI
jgi:hypothetical protein